MLKPRLFANLSADAASAAAEDLFNDPVTFEEMNDFVKSNPVQNFSNTYVQSKSQSTDESRDDIITKIQDAEKFSTTPGILEKNLQQIWSQYSEKLGFMQVEDQDFYNAILQARKKAEQTVRTRSNNGR